MFFNENVFAGVAIGLSNGARTSHSSFDISAPIASIWAAAQSTAENAALDALKTTSRSLSARTIAPTRSRRCSIRASSRSLRRLSAECRLSLPIRDRCDGSHRPRRPADGGPRWLRNRPSVAMRGTERGQPADNCRWAKRWALYQNIEHGQGIGCGRYAVWWREWQSKPRLWRPTRAQTR